MICDDWNFDGNKEVKEKIDNLESLGFHVLPKWCHHIRMSPKDQYGNYSFGLFDDFYGSPDERKSIDTNWNFCPICGTIKPDESYKISNYCSGCGIRLHHSFCSFSEEKEKWYCEVCVWKKSHNQ